MSRHQLGKPLPGFERINRYWDRQHSTAAAKILPGEYYVTKQDEIITTVLGSCVSACVWDQVFGIGGMNHFMPPLSESGNWGGGAIISGATRYGNYAMEHMINDILKHGGHRPNLAVKIFGGGKIISNISNVGGNNVDFVKSYIQEEGLKLMSEDVGDIYPRKVVFFPASGRVRVKKLKRMHNDTIVQREKVYQHDIEQEPLEGAVELF
ncbi:chemoreceptor glutamine deamidase CheD [endosymbiont of Ridgeia piscesae]|jgi:chemotaxis protein CheD|uniref:Probable chemoreceptor glutamine deamidase CheD n=1 Tax=endosymbiont of Ridgeia piscesae TaxID=54398 RepID=A0A0T5Z0S0_9GAMM|nr:chemoreceptor glutamine deamidase CheD [endosymbiont of Ridgeia piscesae]KRT56411.1 Chemotaxis receptor (MCP) glutamine deamidase CheD [endosymbiont of Ridgeia piscesae]KRT59642.1 chemotaxis protein CheD [endosymbiont of Ridgeia piscesae]